MKRHVYQPPKARITDLLAALGGLLAVVAVFVVVPLTQKMSAIFGESFTPPPEMTVEPPEDQNFDMEEPPEEVEEEPEPEVDVDELFAAASKKKGVKDLDAFWDDAVERTGNIPTNPDVITFADAQKLGLKPGEAPIRVTGPLRPTGSLKKK